MSRKRVVIAEEIVPKYTRTCIKLTKKIRFFGVGALYDGWFVQSDFISNGIACVGWDIEDYPEFVILMSTIKKGDVIYIKSAGPGCDLKVKAVGLVTHNDIYDFNHITSDREDCEATMGVGVKVDWIFKHEVTLPNSFKSDKFINFRTATIYPEYSPRIQKRLWDMIQFPKKYKP